MKIGVLGSGAVAQAIGGKLAELGHEVKLGTREPQKLADWISKHSSKASAGSFEESAAFGEIVFNCTNGMNSLEALQAAGEANLNGKILVDVANPLDFSKGFPPSLGICNTDSLGEQIQRIYPQAKVVKTLNTTNNTVMVNPMLVPGDHDMFMCGNDAEAKVEVTKILTDGFGWQSVIDLGDITNARSTEMLLPIWVRLYGLLQTPNFNFRVVR
jgi:8-hydroxy-5-deazaflavin:NADPH oxidoreductase